METAVSLPDAVFEQAERFARRMKRSRSKLYAEALAEYLARHAPDAITEAMDAALVRIHPGTDAFVSVAARKTLRDSSW